MNTNNFTYVPPQVYTPDINVMYQAYLKNQEDARESPKLKEEIRDLKQEVEDLKSQLGIITKDRDRWREHLLHSRHQMDDLEKQIKSLKRGRNELKKLA